MANNLDNTTIYDIFRACRLCGAGGGYKMPIIQSIVRFTSNEVELKQKIKECLQIEVSLQLFYVIECITNLKNRFKEVPLNFVRKFYCKMTT